MKRAVLIGILSVAAGSFARDPLVDVPYDRAADQHGFTVYAREAGWCWFQDPRAIVHNGYLIAGTVKGQGEGPAQIATYDLKNKKALGSFVAHANFDRDDHNAPAFYARPDGSVLAVYARHGREKRHYYRVSTSDDFTRWGTEKRIEHGAFLTAPRDKATYMNLYNMSDEGKLYNFYRGKEYNPTFVTSKDGGLTWGENTHFIKSEVKGRHRPYARYAGNGKDTVHVSFTDGHPHVYGNSIYYAAFRAGSFYRADGSLIHALSDGPLRPGDAEVIYQGGGESGLDNAAWTSSMVVDADGFPHIGYSVHHAREDHRYRIASWNGSKWIDREVACGGNCLYERQSSYTGLITLDPKDPAFAVISTDVDPKTGKATGGPHEIYCARIGAGASRENINWIPVTESSPVRNLRPVIVYDGDRRIILWNRGNYANYISYDLDLVGTPVVSSSRVPVEPLDARAEKAAAARPNVVILYADDMGYGDLGANRPGGRIPTPNLDRLAAQGMRFTDGHSSSGICSPSRFAMLTGQHHWRRFHNIVQAFGASVFRPDDFTLPKMFGEKGYNTAAIGKWHLGWDWNAVRKPGAKMTPVRWARPDGRVLQRLSYTVDAIDWTKPVPGGPLDQGFGMYFGDGTINFPPYCFIENNRVPEAPSVMMDTGSFKAVPEGDWEFRPGPMVKGWDPYKVLPTITDKAVAWIANQTNHTPFFLYFAFPSPHAPIIPNDAFRGKSTAGPYGDFVVETDAMAGRILKALEEAGLADNTIVVFTADNGAEKYAYARQKTTGHWSSGPFRGLKRDLWEGGHRVPFVIRWPGVIQAGSVSGETVSQVDLAATFADIIGYNLKANEAIDSYDLAPLLKGGTYDQPLRTATVQNTRKGAFALRQGDWMYIDAKTGEHSASPDWFNQEHGYKADSTPGLLYNLKEDPAQQYNRFAEYPEKVQQMKNLLHRYVAGKACAPHAR